TCTSTCASPARATRKPLPPAPPPPRPEDSPPYVACRTRSLSSTRRSGSRGSSGPSEARWSTCFPSLPLLTRARARDSRISAVRRGKRSKSRVTCEVTPHHFALTEADVGDYDTNFKMNPPLRSASDREAILVALADGTIDAIATDHAPHAPHEKIIEFERAAFGITG